jgi:hypothetical protein
MDLTIYVGVFSFIMDLTIYVGVSFLYHGSYYLRRCFFPLSWILLFT